MKYAAQKLHFRNVKLVEWWSQCFLGNADTVLCGFRDDGGIVRNVRTYEISEIIYMAQAYILFIFIKYTTEYLFYTITFAIINFVAGLLVSSVMHRSFQRTVVENLGSCCRRLRNSNL